MRLGLVAVEQAAQFPVAVAQGHQQHRRGFVARGDSAGAGGGCHTAEHGVGLAVFDQPLRAVFLGGSARQRVQHAGAQAQQPIPVEGVVRRAQAQVNDAGITVIAIVIDVAPALRRVTAYPLFQKSRVRAGATAVEHDIASWAEQGQALHIRHHCTQLVDHSLLLILGAGEFVERELVEGGFGLERQAQTDVVSQVCAVMDAGQVLLFEGFLELFN